MCSISEPERFPGVGVVIKETFLCVPVENSIIKTFFLHSFLKQCFAQSSIDTIWWYLQLMTADNQLKVPPNCVI